MTNAVNVSSLGAAMTADASGNVGVGTTSPSSKLQVAGDVRINTVGTATTGLPIYAKQTNNDQRGIWTESATTDSNGRFYCDNSVVGIAASYSSTGSYLPITFTTSATERARIDSSGNLLVGTTVQDVTLNRVNGAVLNGGSNAGRIFTRSTGGHSMGIDTTTATQIQWWTDNGSSRVAAGTISSSGSTTAYNTSSDYRLKENIQPMQGALDKVVALNPVTFSWKDTGINTQGFIAHELQEIAPDCVTGEKDAVDADGNPVYQGIDTSFLVATLTAAIQEQQALITSLTERITALEAK